MRPIENKDIGVCIEYMEEAMSNGLYSQMSRSPLSITYYIRAAMQNKRQFYLQVIEHDDRCIGGLFGHVFKPVFSTDLMAEDFAIFVKEEYRNRVGHALIKLVGDFEVWAKEQGAKIIVFGITAGIDNEKAHKLYSKLGFPEIGYIHGRRL